MPTPVHPTAHADQVRAASAHARTTLKRLGTSLGGTVHDVGPASPWLAAHAARLQLALATGAGQRCPHIGPAPRLAVAAVWAPGHLVCPACSPALTPPTVLDDESCDRCGRHATALHPGVAAVGPVLLAYGLCCPCLDATGLNPAGEPHSDADRDAA